MLFLYNLNIKSLRRFYNLEGLFNETYCIQRQRDDPFVFIELSRMKKSGKSKTPKERFPISFIDAQSPVRQRYLV